jgi:predicted phosphodiesterase
MPRLLAISDLHLSQAASRGAVVDLPPCPDDWLIVAGDVGSQPDEIAFGFAHLAPKFARVVWVPGNHDLWSVPGRSAALRGVAHYDFLVTLARSFGIVTPEDPYPVFEHESGPLVLVPMFILYDYSFRPADVPVEQVYAWAEARACVCNDEIFLHPDPYPSRPHWCRARVDTTIARLQALADDVETVLINHFPLEEGHAVLPRAPRFTPWCGTKLTRCWHKRFRARAVVFGHLHIRGTRWLDGVPFQEVSLGYQSQWDQSRPLAGYLHEVELSPRHPRV